MQFATFFIATLATVAAAAPLDSAPVEERAGVKATLQIETEPDTFIGNFEVPVPGQNNFNRKAVSIRIGTVSGSVAARVQCQGFDNKGNKAGQAFGGDQVAELRKGTVLGKVACKKI
ncbi:uncharacterized protein JN550_008373 [Neoarthrinium moseri]|uniref:uncharacterized protein n=1 Tax=Neoarthrinium moseri TaxID=1658444 RepID=UPI001FDAE90D|nr:uncharacterized protein JN550_008373 [Neoarthrinium moseri]KAI1865325.1 hypothetical protein JN550_008373 [Neoarthrinium moseri]